MNRRARGIDPATGTSIRCGNAISPGLSLATGVRCLIHAAVRRAVGAPVTNRGLMLEVFASSAMTIAGGIAMVRQRYFFVVIETTTGRKRLGWPTRPALTVLLEDVGRTAAPGA